MKNKPTTRPNKQSKSTLKKTPFVKTALLVKKKKPAKKTGKNKIGTPDNANLHKMEKELRETKERLRLLSEAANEGIALHDKGIILDANEALARMFGYELSEMIGMNAEDLSTPESWKVIQKHIATGNNKPYEGVGLRKDGSTFICSLVGKPYKSKGRTLRLSTFHDITESKRMEEKLRSDEKIFRTLAEQSSDIIVFANREGIVTYENPAVEKCLGFKQEERIGVNLFDRIHPDDFTLASDAFNAWPRDINAPVPHFEIRLLHKDGSWRTFEAVGSKLVNNNIVEIAIVNLRDITERKKVEHLRKAALDALRESEKSLRAQYNGNPIPTLTWQKQGNEFILRDFNDSAKTIMGSQWKFFLGIQASELYKSRQDVLRTFQICFEEKRIISIESRSQHFMPGKLAVITFVFVPSDMIMVHMEDITERKQAEESLKEAELKFRTIFDQASDGILLLNIKLGKFSAANEKLCNMMGYTNEELLNLGIPDIHPQDFVPFVIDQAEKQLKKEILVAENIPVMRKDKTVFFADISSSPLSLGGDEYLLGMFRDITERKKVDEAVKVNHAQMLAIFDSIEEPVYVADTETYEMLYINRATKLTWGDTQNRKCHEYLQNRNTPCPFCTNDKILGEYSARSYVWEFQNKVNQRWYRCIDKAIPWPNGRIVRYEMAIDITDRKRAEEELNKYREHLEDLVRERTIKLESSNKELEAFSYSASHDLRAPLRIIEGFSQALLEDFEDKLDIEGKGYLLRIRTATRRMTELIDDLLQLSQITRTEINMENVNLTRIARFVLDELQQSHSQRHVEIRIADDLEETADPKLIRIVFENLLGNAWKFTGKQAKAVIEFGCIKESKKKVYFIRDNGVGFDMAYADKLFAPFQRLHTEEEFPGTGIGLATVRRIIHRHGGKVWTEGATGKGATFYFSLNEK